MPEMIAEGLAAIGGAFGGDAVAAGAEEAAVAGGSSFAGDALDEAAVGHRPSLRRSIDAGGDLDWGSVGRVSTGHFDAPSTRLANWAGAAGELDDGAGLAALGGFGRFRGPGLFRPARCGCLSVFPDTKHAGEYADHPADRTSQHAADRSGSLVAGLRSLLDALNQPLASTAEGALRSMTATAPSARRNLNCARAVDDGLIII